MCCKQGIVLKASLLLTWTAFTILAGCNPGGSTIQATGSEDQAKQAVQMVLDAWKLGTPLSEFSAAHPEFVVADQDWQGGTTLANYTLAEPATLNGSHWRQKAELQLKGKSKSKPVVAIYAVTLTDKVVVLRSDFEY